MLKLWARVPNRVLTTILIGNNLVNMLAAALAGRLTDRLFREVFELDAGSSGALAVAVGGMTLLVLIFGEIFPKTYAKHNAERYLHYSGPLLVFYYLVYPMTICFVALSRGLATIVGAKITKDGPMVRIEDIEHMVRVGAKSAALDEEQARYLSGVLDLEDRVVREILVPRTDMTAFELGSDLDVVLQTIEDEGYSRYPVFKDQMDEIVGVLYAKDLLVVLAKNQPDPETFDLQALLRAAVFVPESRNVGDLLQDFRTKKTHMGIVVDEHGGIAGLVTLEDVLEEIVGEIYDEFDDEDDHPIQELTEGHFSLDGGAALHDVEQALGIEFPEETDYDSIAGFVLSAAGEMPQPGFDHMYGGFRFVVVDADERRVSRVDAVYVGDDEQQETVSNA
tara:strand:+ start:615 stop:1793 length:1179 start_codon:yes stop_codon:yes gene_type:complete